jgi:hypothetical protein
MTILEEIYVGWKNYIWPNKTVEEMAKKRIAICADKTICDKLKKNKRCAICGCYMPAKVRSPKSKCPRKFW